MKLNLLPTTVSKGKQAQVAIFFSVLIALAGVLGAAYFAVTSNKALDQARDDYNNSTQPAKAAYDMSQQADTIMQAESSVALIRDATLATDMIKMNDEYPDMYESLKPYIPSWFRVNSMSATPATDALATVTLVGTIDTYQQYANLMLAFSRYEDPLTHAKVISVSRSGFDDRSEIVPALTPDDQIGRMHTADAGPIPDDKFARLTYFQQNAQPPAGYTGVGNYGSGTDNTRGAMPTSSLVTVTMVIAGKNLTVPDPRATLSSGAGGGAGASGLPAAGGGLPGTPGGRIPGGPTAGNAPVVPPAPGAAAAGGGKRKKSNAGDDSSD